MPDSRIYEFTPRDALDEAKRIEHIPKNKDTIKFIWCRFDLEPCIAKLPSHIKKIIFGEALNHYSAAQIKEHFQSIPSHITHLDLHNVDFSKFTTQEVIDILKALPPTLKELDIFNTGIFIEGRSDDDILAIIAALPTALQAIHLGDMTQKRWLNGHKEWFNCAGEFARLAFVCKNLPKNITKLDLGGNDISFLRFLQGADWMPVLEALPSHLTHLGLKNIFTTSSHRIDDCVNAMKILNTPEHGELIFLDFSSHEVFDNPSTKDFFENIPQQLQFLIVGHHLPGNEPFRVKKICEGLQHFRGKLRGLDLSACNISEENKRHLTEKHFEPHFSGVSMLVISGFILAVGATAMACAFLLPQLYLLSNLVIAGHVISPVALVNGTGALLSCAGLFGMYKGAQRIIQDAVDPAWIEKPVSTV